MISLGCQQSMHESAIGSFPIGWASACKPTTQSDTRLIPNVHVLQSISGKYTVQFAFEASFFSPNKQEDLL